MKMNILNNDKRINLTLYHIVLVLPTAGPYKFLFETIWTAE